MFRRFLVPLAATALLAGCVTTAPYGYRGDGQGDYYYGAPTTEYRYHSMYPGYGYPYYGPYRPGLSVWGSFGYGGYYGRPYYGNPYYGGYYGYPYYGNPYYGYPRGYRPRRDTQGTNQPNGGAWRNLDEITRRRRAVDGGGGVTVPTPSVPQPQLRPMPRMGDGEGSATGQIIRRGRRSSQQDE